MYNQFNENFRRKFESLKDKKESISRENLSEFWKKKGEK